MVGAAPGAIDQIETSYMDYLEDAKYTIDDAELATDCWLYKYDGLDPGKSSQGFSWHNGSKLILLVIKTCLIRTKSGKLTISCCNGNIDLFSRC